MLVRGHELTDSLPIDSLGEAERTTVRTDIAQGLTSAPTH